MATSFLLNNKGLNLSEKKKVEEVSEIDFKVKKKRHQSNLFKKGLKFRIYPNENQVLLLNQWIGASRFIWNWALGKQKELYQQNGSFYSVAQLSRELTKFREEDDKVWLKAVPRTVLSQTLNHLKTSWEGFFDGIKGKRADQPGKPIFRQKGGGCESATFQVDPRHSYPLNSKKNKFRIPGLGEVRIILSEPIVGDISSITVYRKGFQWFASLNLINVSMENLQRTGNISDISIPSNIKFSKEKWLKRIEKLKIFPNDLLELIEKKELEGMFAFDADFKKGAVATSNGKKVFNLFNETNKKKDLKKNEKKKAFQRVYDRKMAAIFSKAGIIREKNGKWPKGAWKIAKAKGVQESKNIKAIKSKIALINLQEYNRKQDIFHKFTTDVIQNHHTIVMETLNLQSMAKNKEYNSSFRRSFHETSMGEIIRQLKYKAQWYERNIIFVSKWFASSKRCSQCYHKNKNLILKTQQWTCFHCGKAHERDENAAFNLWQEGWRLLQESLQQDSINMLAAGSAVKGRLDKWLIFKKT